MSKYQDYLKSPYWKAVSDAVKARAGYKCQVCNSPHDLHAHHRSYQNKGRELDHLDDLICLCRRCHSIFHGKQSESLPPPPDAAPKKIKSKPFDERMKLAELDMPGGHECLDGQIVLTKENVDLLRTNSAFTRETCVALGFKSIPHRPWLKDLHGKSIERKAFFRALLGRHAYSKGK